MNAAMCTCGHAINAHRGSECMIVDDQGWSCGCDAIKPAPADRFTFDGRIIDLSWLRDDEWIETERDVSQFRAFAIRWKSDTMAGPWHIVAFPGDTLVRDPGSGRLTIAPKADET